jgi:hypothetical protein
MKSLKSVICHCTPSLLFPHLSSFNIGRKDTGAREGRRKGVQWKTTDFTDRTDRPATNHRPPPATRAGLDDD